MCEPRGGRSPSLIQIASHAKTAFIDREDFREEDSASFYGLAPGKTVRLRYAKCVTCVEVVKKDGETDISPFGTALSDDGVLWLCCFNESMVMAIDLNTGENLCEAAVPAPNDVCLSEDGKYAYAACGSWMGKLPVAAGKGTIWRINTSAPFTTKQSLEEIEQLQNLLDQKKSQLLRSADPSPTPHEEDEKKDDEKQHFLLIFIWKGVNKVPFTR